MGLFGFLSKKKIEYIKEDAGWIKVKIGFYLNGEISTKEIKEICNELSELSFYAQFLFSPDGTFLGFNNQIKNKQTIIGLRDKRLSKKFIAKYNKDKSGWHIVFSPQEEEGLYTLEDLNEDLYILWQIDKSLKRQFNLEGNPPSFDTSFDDGKPILIQKEGLMTFEFKVKDRIKYDSKLADKCLGDFYYRLNVVKENKPSRELKVSEAIERSKWLEEVSKLIK